MVRGYIPSIELLPYYLLHFFCLLFVQSCFQINLNSFKGLGFVSDDLQLGKCFVIMWVLGFLFGRCFIIACRAWEQAAAIEA